MFTRFTALTLRGLFVFLLGLFSLMPVVTAQEIDPPSEKPAAAAEIPADGPPPMKNKTIARWGVAFMLSTSAAFAIFGWYVTYKSPNAIKKRATPPRED